MDMIRQEDINQIRSNVDIVDIISSYIPLTPKGRNYFGVCPFHDDHKPSMSVSKEKQIYTCFSCGATGNVFKFVMDYENVSFPESVNIVANKAGLNFHVKTLSERQVVHQSLFDIYDLCSKIYQNNINTIEGREAKEYLKNREISLDAIKEFGIGLATTKRDMITKLLKSKNFKEQDMLRSGIVVKDEKGLYDIYYNRIMFPIWDASGKVVGFSGRVYHGETNYKYINTKETDIFKKGDLLYNYHRAKEFARKNNTVIIMEGQLDVIRAYSVGIKNVIGTMGTAITKKHALLIKRIAKDVILCFDGDQAGAKATMSCIKELESVDIIPKVVRLEDNMDPDEYIKKLGVQAFQSKLDNPMNIMDFKLSYYKKGRDFQNANDVGSYVRDIIGELSSIEDEILRELTLKKISEESNLDIDFLRRKLEEATSLNVKEKKEVKEEAVTLKPEVKQTKYEKAQLYLVYYMLKSKEVIHMYDKKITYMPTEKYRFLAREINHFYETYKFINEADFITYISDDPKMMKTVGEVLSQNLKETYTMEEIEDYIRTIRDYNIKVETERLKVLMHNETDSMKKASIASRIVALKVRGE